MYVKNARELIENGRTEAGREARRFCIEGLESALEAVEPEALVKAKVWVTADGRFLTAGRKRFDLRKYRRILVIGGGKAARGMARAIEEILGERITGGIVNAPEPHVAVDASSVIRLHAATHPLPSLKGAEGVRKMLDLVGTPSDDLLVICLISGGGSAMLPMPREGLTLTDKIETTRILLRVGANIRELNVVRKHLSEFKGGWLAVKLYPATVLSLVISDVVGNRLDSIASGPLYPDSSTFGDAAAILRRYRVEHEVPPEVWNLIRRGSEVLVPDTPKPGSKYFRRVTNIIVGSNEDACAAGARRLKALGCNPTTILTTRYVGEARRVGARLASVLPRSSSGARVRGWVAGGESTVVVKGDGLGGRNQELVLAAAMKIRGNSRVAILAVGTDGIDGPTDAAGAMADGSTIERAGALRLGPREHLRRNDTYPFFKELRELVLTGPTGTNVNDICIMVRW